MAQSGIGSIIRGRNARRACTTLGMAQQTLTHRLKWLGMAKIQGNWVQYELKPCNMSGKKSRIVDDDNSCFEQYRRHMHKYIQKRGE